MLRLVLALTTFVALMPTAHANNCDTPSSQLDRIVGVAPDGTVVSFGGYLQLGGSKRVVVHIAPRVGKATTLTYDEGRVARDPELWAPADWVDDLRDWLTTYEDDAASTARWRVAGPKPALAPGRLTPRDYLEQLTTKLALTPLEEVPTTFEFTWYDQGIGGFGIGSIVLPDALVPVVELGGDLYQAGRPPELRLYKHAHLDDFVLRVRLNVGAECGDGSDQMTSLAASTIAQERLRVIAAGSDVAVARAQAERDRTSFAARMRLLAAIDEEAEWSAVADHFKTPIPKGVAWRDVYLTALISRFGGHDGFDAWVEPHRR